jgi:3-dehydroquinate dehydratase-2|tara:strand:+ start:92 stop:541 length:450 start_codon:yes stop_codon:yes gene_type:complete
MKHKIIVINGPNLNLLGEREKEKYGNISLKDVENNCSEFGNKNNLETSFFQSNIEGELVDAIQKSRNNFKGLIINAGGYTHTSIAIHDALKILKIPIIELHITNIYKREEFRHKSLISTVATGIICGFGTKGYTIALESIKNLLENENR